MNPTDQVVEQAVLQLDEQPTQEPKEETKPEEAPTEAPKEEAPKEEAPKEEEADKEAFKDDEGYLAGDEPAEETPPEEVKPTTPPPTGMTAEQQFIYENLPAITVRGTVNGRPTSISVKVAQQLPDGFEFANKREEVLFNQSLAEQALAGNRLQQQFQQEQQSKQAQEFSTRENQEIQQDIRELQQEGRIPRFKVSPDDPKFADDPAAKQVQDVLDYYNELNKAYIDKGRVARVTFRDAYDLMQVRKNTPQVREDQERKEVAKANASAGTSTNNIVKPIKHASMRDFISSIDALMD